MPFRSLKIDVSNEHKLHVELAGNPDGIPFLFVHGGPGASISNCYKWPFDLNKHFVVAFDQRGCGQSKPFASLNDNNTWALIEDIEKIRNHLQIETWGVFGGSWGATLSLIYAIKHPSHVSKLILRGVFLARSKDAEFFLTPEGAAAHFFPLDYQKFISVIQGKKTAANILHEYYGLMTNSELEVRKNAYQRWFAWELAISRLIKENIEVIPDAKFVETLALMECHYLINNCFIEENYILDNCHIIQDIPCEIVHGRYDLVCMASGAIELAQQLPKANLHIIENAGHSALETQIRNKLIDIMRQHNE
ncbi:prolyl aminopeptidase [Glaciecola sp. 1036]|uniref:prolyl aminopeptidase n=1 Tax=Alteromonadaceae TaxID=72275 RepID=UPI003D077BC6